MLQLTTPLNRVLGADVMTREAIGAIGELVAAVGVILSLVFVGLQLRKNTDAIIDSNVESATERLITLSQLIASDAELARIYTQGMRSFSDLSAEDRTRFASVMYSIFADCWDQYSKHKKGAIDDRVWGTIEGNVTQLLSREGVQQWLATKPMMPTDFKVWIDSQLQDDT